jgi:small-conductance mechanosensitive channel
MERLMNIDKEQLLELLASIAPNRYLQALVIIIVFLALAKILDLIVNRGIKKWVKNTRVKFDDFLIDLFHKPVFVSIILVGLALATGRIEFKPNVYFITISSLKTIGLVLWVIAVNKLAKYLLNLISNDESRFNIVQDRTLPLFNNLLMLVVIGVTLYILFLIWNIDLTAWMASAGIIGLAVSFAAKDTLANLFSGVFIMADAPYKLGDFIVLETGERGNVTDIGIRSTRLLTRDDVEITVPNSIMGNTKVTNEAGGRHEKFRIRVRVGVAYGSDIDKVHEVLVDVAKKNGDVCKTPDPRVRFRGFGDSSLDHELLCWVEKPVLRGRVLHELNTAVYKRFLDENIEIPFPQRDIHIVSQPANPVE